MESYLLEVAIRSANTSTPSRAPLWHAAKCLTLQLDKKTTTRNVKTFIRVHLHRPAIFMRGLCHELEALENRHAYETYKRCLCMLYCMIIPCIAMHFFPKAVGWHISPLRPHARYSLGSPETPKETYITTQRTRLRMPPYRAYVLTSHFLESGSYRCGWRSGMLLTHTTPTV